MEEKKSLAYKLGQVCAATIAVCLLAVMVAVTIKIIGYILF